jgi:multidrug efflux pump
VEFELLLTIGLVVMVIFLFLRNRLYATIIPSVAVRCRWSAHLA